METLETLRQKECVPCEDHKEALTDSEIQEYLAVLDGWVLEEGKLVRNFTFTDFPEALAFVNRVGEIAEVISHHPDINLYSWNKVKLTLYTHSISGLHMNDFILAAKITNI